MIDWHDLRVDGDRLWQRIEALGEIGAVHGPNGERGCARLALTDDDREGRDLVVGWMRDLGHARSASMRSATSSPLARAPIPSAAAVMTGSHIDTVRTGGRFDGNLGVLAGLGGHRDARSSTASTTRHPISVAFFTDEEGARFQPDMLGSLVYVGGMARGGGARRAGGRRRGAAGRRAGAHRIRRPDTRARPPLPARLRRAAHRAGSGAGGRGHHDRRRHRRAGDLVDRGDGHRSVGARRHDADAAAPRRRLVAAARCNHRDALGRGRDGRRTQVATVGRCRCACRTSSTSIAVERDDHASICATPTKRCCSRPRARCSTPAATVRDR